MNRFYKTQLLLGLGIVFSVSLFGFSHTTFAQSQTLNSGDITAANGWDCTGHEATKSLCTNTKKDSPYYKSTASCSTNALAGGGSIDETCQITKPDGSTVTSNTNTSGGLMGGTTSGDTVSRDSKGNVTDVVSNDSVLPSSCSITDLGQCLISTIGGAMLGVSNFLLGIAGTLLNFVVVKTVFQFSTIIGNSPGLLIAWRILRDIGNMVLLFGFIFIGIATILDLHTYTAKNALPKLIIFAVLMNFSLFAAEAVIDVSNVFSTVMYSQANTDPCTTQKTDVVSGGGSLTGDCGLNYGLAGHIMEASGLSSIFSTKAQGVSFSVYVGLALFALIGSVVFLAAAIMLAIRAVTLTFLMVLAPLGFAGMAIPPLQSMAKKWWHTLIHQAFFAPILLLLILVSLKIADGFGTVGGAGLAGALSQPNVSTMGIFFVFTLVIGFLVAALVAAKNFGAMGAAFAIKTAGSVTGGASGYIGRNTLGWSLNKANDKLRSSAFGQTRYGRRLATITEKGAKGTYDFRAAPGAGAALKPLGDLGKPAKDGYVGQVKRGKEEYTKYAGTLTQTKDAKKQEAELNAQKEGLKKTKETAEKAKEKAQKEWSNRRKQMQEEVTRQQSAMKYDDESRQRSLAMQQSKVDEAVKKGDSATADRERQEYSRLSSRYDQDRQQQEATLKSAQDAIRQGETEHEGNVERFNKDIEGVDAQIKAIDGQLKGDIDKDIAGVDSESSKRQFAINIKNSVVPPWKFNARKQAAEAIKKDLKKSKTEKLLEGLKHSIDENKHDAGEKLDEVKHAVEADTKGGGGDHGGGGGDHGH